MRVLSVCNHGVFDPEPIPDEKAQRSLTRIKDKIMFMRIVGRTIDEIAEITGGAILEKLGTFPEENRHCAFLGAETLQEALMKASMTNPSETSC